jgi:hypothetical protein
MAGQTLTVVELTADNVEDVLAVSPLPEQLQYVNPVAWYVARSAYQNVWQPVGLTTEDGAVVGFAEWAYDESDGTYGLGGITIDHRQQGRVSVALRSTHLSRYFMLSQCPVQWRSPCTRTTSERADSTSATASLRRGKSSRTSS